MAGAARQAATALGIIFGVIMTYGCAGLTVSVGSPPETQGRKAPAAEKAGAEKGPPPWAPAHGHRAKHRYRYYPSAEIYFDVSRKVYFYDKNGQWQVSAELPGSIRARLGDTVTLEMDTEHPYQYHNTVRDRYPPGQGKGRKKGWEKRDR
ncbi:MAG: hypothetical protein V5B78_08960 [Desulfohalobiaceae bacterium]